jgi:hypothetical protein
MGAARHRGRRLADPCMHVESSCTIDLSQSQFEVLDDRRVRVTGSQFIPAETYTVKLEGAEVDPAPYFPR